MAIQSRHRSGITDMDTLVSEHDISRIDKYGCFVWLIETNYSVKPGHKYLLSCEINDFERAYHEDMTLNDLINLETTVDVSAPESQDFLDAVNSHFGTKFTLDQFSGR